MQDFTIWLEFEYVDYSTKWDRETEAFTTGGEWDRENELCNVIVDLPDGQHYGINVWTYAFLATVVALDAESGKNLHGTYQKPPDLFVKEPTRECIEATIADLLKAGNSGRRIESNGSFKTSIRLNALLRITSHPPRPPRRGVFRTFAHTFHPYGRGLKVRATSPYAPRSHRAL